MKDVRFEKGNEIYIFRYLPGHEDKLLDVLAEIVINKDLSLDRPDAAVISYTIGQQMRSEK